MQTSVSEPGLMRDTSAQDQPRSKTKRPWWWRLSWLLPLLLLLLLLPAFNRWQRSDQTVLRSAIRVGQVTQGRFERDVIAQGRVVAANAPMIYSPHTGVVSLRVQAGDRVHRHGVLAVIDSPELSNELAREKASLLAQENDLGRAKIERNQKMFDARRAIDKAQIELTAAEREQRRADDPRVSLAISQIEREKIRDNLAKTKIEFSHAEQQAVLLQESTQFDLQAREKQVDRQRLAVSNLQQRVNALTIRSPVDGMVGVVNSADKAVVMINTPLLSVIDLSAYAVELDIAESYADELLLGMTVELTINGKNYDGELKAIAPEVKNGSVTARVVWRDAAPNDLRQSQRLHGRLLLESRDNVVIAPNGPWLDNATYAFRVVDSEAKKIPIKIGARSVSHVEIIEGLNPGDTILLSSTTEYRNSNTMRISE